MTSIPADAHAKAPWHLWAFGGLMLLWNAFGAFDFTATALQLEFYLGGFPQEFRDYWNRMPIWRWVFWGTAVWTALIGTVLLVLRKPAAVPVLLVSLLAAIFSMATSYLDEAVPEGASNPILIAVILLIALGLWLYARAMATRGVLA
ncbi:MAG: hypothetical protein AAGK23_08735 [Pseudomonadota bacterium]